MRGSCGPKKSTEIGAELGSCLIVASTASRKLGHICNLSGSLFPQLYMCLDWTVSQVPGTQAGQSPKRLFSPSGEGTRVQQSLGRRPLRVPYEPIGGVENLLACAQPVELTHHGSHPARGVEHGLTHLWG